MQVVMVQFLSIFFFYFFNFCWVFQKFPFFVCHSVFTLYLKVKNFYNCEVSGEHFTLCRITVEEGYCKGHCIGIQETGAKCNW